MGDTKEPWQDDMYMIKQHVDELECEMERFREALRRGDTCEAEDAAYNLGEVARCVASRARKLAGFCETKLEEKTTDA